LSVLSQGNLFKKHSHPQGTFTPRNQRPKHKHDVRQTPQRPLQKQYTTTFISNLPFLNTW